jgi:hypothetical protein
MFSVKKEMCNDEILIAPSSGTKNQTDVHSVWLEI